MLKTKYTNEELINIQISLETEMSTRGVKRLEANNERALQSGEASSTLYSRKLMQAKLSPFIEAVKAHLEYYQHKSVTRAGVINLIRQLPAEKSAFICFKVVLDYMGLDKPVATIVERIGQRIEDEIRMVSCQEAAPRFVEKALENMAKAKTKSYGHKHRVSLSVEKALTEDKSIEKRAPWTTNQKSKVGSELLDLMTRTVLFKEEPLVCVEFKRGPKGPRPFLAFHKETSSWISEYNDVISLLFPDHGPCVIPPREWKGPRNGGYYIPEVAKSKPISKTKHKKQLRRLTKDQMPAVYDCLNTLQSVAWSINDNILDTLSHILENDLAIATPSQQPLEMPPFPFVTELRGKALKESLSEEENETLSRWKADKKETMGLELERQGKVIETSRIYNIAKRYQPFEEIFYVYTTDFRGRIYATGSAVGPQGSDLGKALVRFSKGAPLGDFGKYWLAVHGANVFGFDKATFNERVDWVLEHEDEILDSAADPFAYQFWTEADKPWQFLAWAKEWYGLHLWEEEGNPTTSFISYIPCAQDGSCSGIQHYSAMLRDKIGGSAVNLVPSNRPQDIYGDVARVARTKVRESLTWETKDLTTGTPAERRKKAKENALKRQASYLLSEKDGKPFVNRDMCKTPVMTLPYGSTQMTCLDAVDEYFRGKGSWLQWEDLEERTITKQAMSSVVWSSIGEVVVAARDGMAFIQGVASQMAKANHGLTWTTPTGFVVVQEEFETKKQRVRTVLHGVGRFDYREATDKIDVNRTRNASAPNFIHSLDASHLTMAVNECKAKGLDSLAVIHDSFGTHAGHTETLRKALLETFVRLYKNNDPLEDFLLDCEEVKGDEIDIEKPKKGDLDIEAIRDSLYCFA